MRLKSVLRCNSQNLPAYLEEFFAFRSDKLF